MADIPKSVSNAASETTDDVAKLKADLNRLSDTVASLVSARADSARSTMSDMASKLREQGEAVYRDAESRAREKAKDLEQTIVNNPFASVAAAFGIGVLFSMLTRRR
jgi:ElaB/YqjD/DUF883 family membrane-anchored ribosome-binding protein